MGNKQHKSRSKSDSDVVGNGGCENQQPKRSQSGRSSKGGKKGVKNSASADDISNPRDRVQSCPTDPRQVNDGGGRAGGLKRPGEDGQQLEVKIYRSYSNLTDSRHSGFVPDPLDTSNIKVYRRSAASLSALQNPNRAASLPRGFGRSKSYSTAPISSTLGPELRHSAGRANDVRGNTMSLGRAPSVRTSTASTASYMSTAPGYKVNREDFPDSNVIKKKLKQFEKCFIHSFTERYSQLPSVTQLTCLAIAYPIEDDDGGSTPPAVRPISLFEYMRDEEGLIPVNLHEMPERFVMSIPPALFPGIAHVRRSCPGPVDSNVLDDWSRLSRDIVTCVVAESAGEISRMFEYQIALLGGDMSIQLVADHCAERSIAYVVPDPLNPFVGRLDRNTVIHGAVRGSQGVRGTSTSSYVTQEPPKYISVIIGMKELKWNIYEIFSKPGLRRDILLLQEEVPLPGEDDRSPWTFHTTSSGPSSGAGPSGTLASDHMTYGYRGQMIDWDFLECVYKLNGADERRFIEESEWRYDDFHRLYAPYKRLVGSRAIKKYCLEQARVDGGPSVKLEKYLRQMCEGTGYSRDVIQVVYRPLEKFIIPGGEKSSNFSGVEMPPRMIMTAPGEPEPHVNGPMRSPGRETNVNDTLERRRPNSVTGNRSSNYVSPTQAHVLSPEDYYLRNGGTKYDNRDSMASVPRHTIRSDI